MNDRRSHLATLRQLLAVLSIAGIFILSGCGSQSQVKRPNPDSPASATLSKNADGTLAFSNIKGPLAGYPYYKVVPQAWPENKGPAPVLATGFVAVDDSGPYPVEFAAKQVSPNTRTRVVGTLKPVSLGDNKLTAQIINVRDSQVRINRGIDNGISRGDRYFVLNRNQWNPNAAGSGFGQHIGAILEISDIGEDYAIGSVRHADIPIEKGDFAVFAQVQTTDAIPAATLLFAPLGPKEEGQSNNPVPTLARNIQNYMSRFLITNISISSLKAPINPIPWDAAKTAINRAPDDAFGTVIFGSIDQDSKELIYNATMFGNPPHPGNTVGILPGGMRLPLKGKAETLSKTLAPSYIATALAQRNEHATAIYLLEYALRHQKLPTVIQYHLREHLALRYHAIGRTQLATRIMSADIVRSRKSNNSYAQLNALSIRSLLLSEAGLYQQQVENIRTFIELAQDKLPKPVIARERVAYARALRSAGKLEKAKNTIINAIDYAESTQDTQLKFRALFELALIELNYEHPEGALLVLADLMDMSEEVEPENMASLYSIAGLLHAEAGRVREATRYIGKSLQTVSTINSKSLRARISERAASALISTQKKPQALQYLQFAIQGYSSSYQFGQAAEILAQLAYQELNVANQSHANDQRSGAQLVAMAREHLANASQSLVVLGRNLEAASQFFALGVLYYRLGDKDSARIALDRARSLSMQSADFEGLAAIAQQRAELAAQSGSVGEEAQYREEAQFWLDVAGIQQPTPDKDPGIESPPSQKKDVTQEPPSTQDDNNPKSTPDSP